MQNIYQLHTSRGGSRNFYRGGGGGGGGQARQMFFSQKNDNAEYAS